MDAGHILKKVFPWFIIGFGSIIGTILGFLSWKVLHYWRKLIKQPFLIESVLPVDIEDHQTVEAKGLHIAAANLRGGIETRLLSDGQEKLILCAGKRNFREPWARDLSFASFGNKKALNSMTLI